MMTALSDLLAVQTTDIAISQAKHRITHLQETIDRDAAKSALAEIDTQIAQCDAEVASASAEITKVDRLSHEHDDKLVKLNKQLKTVIAPREAEALQHEIATVTTERSSLDDRELELMGRERRVETADPMLRALEIAYRSTRAALDQERRKLGI
jgi:predicted  nucleic acid-binding Zn-ribbon protein